MLVTILSFIVVLGVLIFIHEFGHFIVARKVGVKVLTFSIGFGPKLFKRTVGDTEYALSAFPLGGYVRLLGDDPKEEIDPSERHRSFLNQKVSKKIAIVFAGPLFNLLLAAVIFSGIFIGGVPSVTSEIGKVREDSPAQQAGFQSGDRMVMIDGHPVEAWEEIVQYVQASEGREMQFTVERAGSRIPLKVTAVEGETLNLFQETVSVWVIGVESAGEFVLKHHNPAYAVYLGIEKTWEMTKLTVIGIYKLIQGKLPANTIGGPIMIAQIAGEQVNKGFLNIMLFVAILSINLGVINLLPIPILDGGHLLFFAIEAVMGKPVSLRKREIAQQVGLFLLIFLMLFAVYNDVDRIMTGPKE